MTEKIIFVFPGQGAQYVGMGADLFNDFAAARYVYEEVSEIANVDVAKISFAGDQRVLSMPVNTSLSTFAHSVAVARVIENEFGTPLYNIGYAMAGHSMGQYSALHCAGSLSMVDAVNILSMRSSYMSFPNIRGGMVAVVGLEYKDVLRDSTRGGYAEVSNHNARDQFIISGEDAALDIVVESALGHGARLARRLNVSIPAHCALMAGAEQKLRKALKNVPIAAPRTNWFSNQTANTMSNPEDVRDALADQMTHGVRWYEIMKRFPEYNICLAYELGPGRTLTALINRAHVGCVARQTDVSKNVNAILDNLARLMAHRENTR